MAIDELLTAEQKKILESALLAVMAHGFGDIRLVIDNHQVRFIVKSISYGEINNNIDQSASSLNLSNMRNPQNCSKLQNHSHN